MYGSFLDVGNGVLNRTGEGVHGNGLGGLCSLQSSLGSLHNAGALQCGDLHNLAAQLTTKLRRVDGVAVLLYHVHHVDSHHNRDTKLGELSGQVKVTLQVGAIDDVQDGVGALLDQVVAGNNFLHSVGGQGVDTGKVGDGNVAVLLQLAFLLFNGNTGPVTNELVCTGEGVEQGSFTAVRVARQGDG